MATVDPPNSEVEAVRQSLLTWQAEGIANPQIVVDGGPDFGVGVFGLNDRDEVVRIYGATVEDTVSLSLGGGVETNRQDAADG